MIRPLTLLALGALATFMVGCSSKPLPQLYRPGDIAAWRTVNESELDELAAERPHVRIDTTEGSITIELFEDSAPISTANFLRYVEEGYYAGTIFHRVIDGFMIQGGGFEPGMIEKETYEPIRNEAGNGLKNVRGTLAMARTNDLNSATSQFFINLVDNAFLNGDGVSDGYAVFGRVIDGMDIVERIAQKPTESVGAFADVPVAPIIITGMTQVD
jgi:peptidyl-prolyl cis-trans isomerase A (cyclophilin A)